MKNLFILTSLLLFIGCNKESENKETINIPMSYWDNTFYFKLQDKDGNDLLDTLKAGHYKFSDIEITNKRSPHLDRTHVEIHKQKDEDYYYVDLGLIMPLEVGELMHVEVETTGGKEMAWISYTDPTITKVKFGNGETHEFKAVYKTYQIDIPDMLGGNSTVVKKIWHNDKLIIDKLDKKADSLIIPIIILDANDK